MYMKLTSNLIRIIISISYTYLVLKVILKLVNLLFTTGTNLKIRISNSNLSDLEVSNFNPFPKKGFFPNFQFIPSTVFYNKL